MINIKPIDIKFDNYGEISKSKASVFCSNCLCENPKTDGTGYTCCCNQPTIGKDEAMMWAKSYDIDNFLHTFYGLRRKPLDGSYGVLPMRTFTFIWNDGERREVTMNMGDSTYALNGRVSETLRHIELRKVSLSTRLAKASQ